MIKIIHRFKVFLALFLVVSIVAACSNSSTTSETTNQNNEKENETEGTSAEGGVINVAIVDDAQTLDPQKTNQLSAHLIFRNLFDRLVYIDDNNQPQPWVAESWQISDDNKEVTFKIREGIKFHNGETLDANAVKFTFDRIRAEETASPTGGLMVGSLENIEVIDDYNVKFVFSAPFAPFFINLSSGYVGILPPSLGGKGENFGREPIGSGPFMFKEWMPGSEIRIVKNPDYNWGRVGLDPEGPVKIDEIVYKVIPEEGTRMAALETNEIQISSAPIELADSIKMNDALSLIEWKEATNYYSIEFNATKAPFDDPEMRRAIGSAVDAEQIIAGAWSGYATPNKNPLGMGLFGHTPEIGEENGIKFDPDNTKEILESKGYELGNDGFYEKDGKAVTFSFLTGNDPKETRAAQIIQSQLNDVGIKVDIQVVEGSAYRPTLQEGKHDFHMQRWNWVDPIIMSFVFKEGGMVGLYQNDELDAILTKADQELNSDTRLGYLQEAQKKILSDAAVIPLLTETVIDVTRKEVQGYKWDSLGYPVWSNVTIKK